MPVLRPFVPIPAGPVRIPLRAASSTCPSWSWGGARPWVFPRPLRASLTAPPGPLADVALERRDVDVLARDRRQEELPDRVKLLDRLQPPVDEDLGPRGVGPSKITDAPTASSY